jgi:hypothetical protein
MFQMILYVELGKPARYSHNSLAEMPHLMKAHMAKFSIVWLIGGFRAKGIHFKGR